MNPLRVVEVCAGIGGISLGFEMAGGFEHVAFVERDPYAKSILKKHWPAVPQHSDIRDVSAWNLPPCDVLAGGIPCQPHSLAGKRGAGSDERDLWPDFFRLICEIRPRYAVVENVPGLRSSDRGLFFGRILRDLASVGYDAEWVSLSAADVGAPHERERVWIVAHPQQPRHRRQVIGGQTDGAHTEGSSGRTSRAADVANTAGDRWRQGSTHVCGSNKGNRARAEYRPDDSGKSCDVSHADCLRCAGREYQQEPVSRCCSSLFLGANGNRQQMAHADGAGQQEQHFAAEPDRTGHNPWCPASAGHQWAVEPDVGRVAHGVPARVDRLRCLGNGVVPECAAVIAGYIRRHYEEANP